MSLIAKRIKYLRESLKDKDNKWTQGYVAGKIGVARVTYTAYENDTKTPPPDIIILLSDLFGVSTDYILGQSNSMSTEKDEQDIAKRIGKFKDEIEQSDGLAFDGEPMSDEAKESLIESMEHIFRMTQRINKKYIPKKYRDKE